MSTPQKPLKSKAPLIGRIDEDKISPLKAREISPQKQTKLKVSLQSRRMSAWVDRRGSKASSLIESPTQKDKEELLRQERKRFLQVVFNILQISA